MGKWRLGFECSGMLTELLLLLFLSLASCPVAFFLGNCPCCSTPCTRCSSTPASYQVVITGLANTTCSNCSTYNATYIIPQSIVVDSSGCTWQIGVNSTACGSGTFAYYINVQATVNGAQTRLRCMMVLDGFGNSATWQDDIGTNPANCSVSGLSLTINTDFANLCTNASSTCTVTA